MTNSPAVFPMTSGVAQAPTSNPQRHRESLSRLTALICKKTLWKVGDKFSQVAIARAANTSKRVVSMWCDPDSDHAPNARHHLTVPQEFFDALINELCAARTKYFGFPERVLVAPAESRSSALDEARAKAQAAAEELARVMRSAR